jgi:hypothetical protein
VIAFHEPNQPGSVEFMTRDRAESIPTIVSAAPRWFGIAPILIAPNDPAPHLLMGNLRVRSPPVISLLRRVTIYRHYAYWPSAVTVERRAWTRRRVMGALGRARLLERKSLG